LPVSAVRRTSVVWSTKEADQDLVTEGVIQNQASAAGNDQRTAVNEHGAN
jgi:hypothetical protein